MTVQTDVNAADWPAPVSIEAARVVRGAPEASTLVLHDDGRTQLGLWRVTAGEVTTRHKGYVEAITIAWGRGRLVSDHGQVLELSPGSVVVLESGWTGRWVVDETIIKSCAVLQDV